MPSAADLSNYQSGKPATWFDFVVTRDLLGKKEAPVVLQRPTPNLPERGVWLTSPPMKLLWAIIAYVVIGIILGWGMILMMKGSPWLLVIGFLAYVVAFGKIGCLPKKSH